MKQWLADNLLAAYGAIVGTIALMLNLSKFAVDLRKDSVRLKVSGVRHPMFDGHAATLKQPLASDGDGPNLLEGYSVTVTNLGSIQAHIADVGVICRDGRTDSALVRQHSSRMILRSVPEIALEPLEPKSSRTFTVYLRRGHEPPIAEAFYALDKTGKRWKTKV
jgi:hypothetical protein